jgi:hypothetical protein
MSAGSNDDARDRVGAGEVSAAILACFDDAAADIFAAHARLTGGDRDRSTTLLVETFRELVEDALREAPARRTMVDRAHRTFLRRATAAGPGNRLSPVEAVVLDLAVVEHRSSAEIATVIAAGEDAVEPLLAAARRHITGSLSGPDEERLLRSGEIWLDDITRRAARAAVAQAAEQAAGAPARTAPVRAPTTATTRSRRGRGLLAAASVATVCIVAFVAWPSPSASPSNPLAGTRTTHLAPFLPPRSTSTSTSISIAASTSIPSEASTDSGSTVVPFIGGVGPGYVFDPLPSGYAVLGAQSIDPSVTGPATGWLELWASAGATRASGRWLAMLVVPTEPATLALARETSSRQLVIGNDHALQWTQNDGVSRLSVSRAGHGAVEFQSFGLGEQELRDFAADTTLNAANQPRYGDVALSVLRGMTVQLARATAEDTFAAALFNRTTSAWVAYGSTASNDMIVVLTTLVEPNGLVSASLLGPGDIIQATSVSGNAGSPQPVVVGRSDEELLLKGARTSSFVQFHDVDYTVSIIGTTTLNLLTGLAASVRLMSDAEWHGFLEQRPPVQTPSATQPVSSATIGANTAANGTAWTIELADQAGGTLHVAEQRPATRSTDPPQFDSAAGTASAEPSIKHPVVIWNTPDAQLIVVTFAEDPGADTVEITSAAGLITPVAIVRIGEADLWGAALAVVDASGSRVEMTDRDGNRIPLS